MCKPLALQTGAALTLYIRVCAADGTLVCLFPRHLPAGQSGAAIALMGFTFLFFWFVCGLSGFHTWLVATNQTTYENFR